MRNLFFLISEAHRNFSDELFDSVEAQRNSAIEISQHNANTAFFAIFEWKE